MSLKCFFLLIYYHYLSILCHFSFLLGFCFFYTTYCPQISHGILTIPLPSLSLIFYMGQSVTAVIVQTSAYLMHSSTAVQVVVDGVLAVKTTQQGHIANCAEKTSTDHLHCFHATTAAVTLWVRCRHVNTVSIQLHIFAVR